LRKKQKTVSSIPQVKAEIVSMCDKILSELTVGEIIKQKFHRPLLILEHNNTVKQALKKLSEEKVLSAPVELNASLEDSAFGTYLGMVDVGCILRHFIRETERLEEEKKLQRNAKTKIRMKRKKRKKTDQMIMIYLHFGTDYLLLLLVKMCDLYLNLRWVNQ